MGKAGAKRSKVAGKQAFYKRMRRDHPGARDVDIRKEWDAKVKKDMAAAKAASDKAKADADLKAARKLQADENEKKFLARKAERAKAEAAKAKAEKEAAELAKMESEAKPEAPATEAPAVTA